MLYRFIFLIILGLFITGCANSDTKKSEAVSAASSSISLDHSNLSDSKLYTDFKNHIQFTYNPSWEVGKWGSYSEEGAVTSFISPELKQEDANLPEGVEYVPADFILIYCADINSNCVKKGGWTGMRDYKNLVDFLTDQNVNQYSGTKKISGITLSEQPAFVVTRDPFETLGIMVEHNGIYILMFPNPTHGLSDPSIKQIISSFKFIN